MCIYAYKSKRVGDSGVCQADGGGQPERDNAAIDVAIPAPCHGAIDSTACHCEESARENEECAAINHRTLNRIIVHCIIFGGTRIARRMQRLPIIDSLSHRHEVRAVYLFLFIGLLCLTLWTVQDLYTA